MENVAGVWRAKKTGDAWQVLDGEERLIATLADIPDAEVKAKQIAVNPYVLEALKSVVELLGDEDIPDNGELSGAAVCDMARAAVEMASQAQ